MAAVAQRLNYRGGEDLFRTEKGIATKSEGICPFHGLTNYPVTIKISRLAVAHLRSQKDFLSEKARIAVFATLQSGKHLPIFLITPVLFDKVFEHKELPDSTHEIQVEGLKYLEERSCFFDEHTHDRSIPQTYSPEVNGCNPKDVVTSFQAVYYLYKEVHGDSKPSLALPFTATYIKDKDFAEHLLLEITVNWLGQFTLLAKQKK